jgi:hypothetical protein
MSAEVFDYQKILENWNTEEERGKAEFLDALYEFYAPGTGCYTGLSSGFSRT